MFSAEAFHLPVADREGQVPLCDLGLWIGVMVPHAAYLDDFHWVQARKFMNTPENQYANKQHGR